MSSPTIAAAAPVPLLDRWRVVARALAADFRLDAGLITIFVASRITAEKNRLRHKDAKNREPRSVDGSSNSLKQPTPFQKNWLLPNVSCME